MGLLKCLYVRYPNSDFVLFSFCFVFFFARLSRGTMEILSTTASFAFVIMFAVKRILPSVLLNNQLTIIVVGIF
jgi:hypothetical protein